MQIDPSDTRNIVGAAAFILSTANLVLGFPILARMDAGGSGARISLILFFTTGILANLAILKYLWELNDFFVRSIYGLEVLSYGILLIHIVMTPRSKTS